MSILGDIFRPIFDLLAGIITFWYALIPSYGIAIALLTLTVMVVLFPLTVRSTKSMLQLQALQPKLKEIQREYKNDRQALAEAQQRLFKENHVSPLGGCLPMLLQFPLLFVMYDVIRGLTNTVKTKAGIVASPKYILHSSLLYKNLVADKGEMKFLGMNLSLTPLHLHIGFFPALPYYALVLISVALQYLQIQQITSKNPQAASANPIASKGQQLMTLVFGFIYLDIPAGVVVYFVVSGLFRVIQQELMWRHDPTLRAHSIEARRRVAEAKNQVFEAAVVAPKQTLPWWRRLFPGASPALSADGSSGQPPATPPKPQRSNRSNKKRRRR